MASENQVKLAEFIQEKLDYIDNQCKLIKQGQVSIGAINDALSRYTGILGFLTNQYEGIMMEAEERKDEYQTDWDTWLIEASNQLNENRTKSKFASATEVEATARIKHREEYLKWKNKLNMLDRKVSFYRRLINNWMSQKDIIIELSRNSRGEMKALGIENLANYDEKKTREEEKPKVKMPKA
jgi:hypothetical protein